jgi:hypothetical protein
VLKQRARSEWTPEYRPESHVPPTGEHSADTVTERATRVNLGMIMENVPNTCARAPTLACSSVSVRLLACVACSLASGRMGAREALVLLHL